MQQKVNNYIFLFFYAPGAHCPEEVRVSFYKCLSDSYSKFSDKGKNFFLGDTNARLGKYTNDFNIHGTPITNKNKPLFMGFTEYCGITLLNNIFAKGTYTYEIPKMKRSIIDMGMTNSLRSVLVFKVLSLNLGVTPQTCHKVLELSIKIVPKPV